MKYIFALTGLLACLTTHATPSYEVGVSASYEPSVISNHSVIRTFGNVNKTFGKFQLGTGLEVDYASQSPTDNIENYPKVSGYQQTKLNTHLGYNISNQINVSTFAMKSIDYNEKVFGKERQSISYGTSVHLQDAQNFAVQATLAKTDYHHQNDGINLGDVLHAGVKFKFGLSQNAQFFIGATHRKQKASTQKINNQSIELSKESSGVGAILGTDYTFDRHRKHHFNFEMQTGIGDLAGHVSTGYRYVF